MVFFFLLLLLLLLLLLRWRVDVARSSGCAVVYRKVGNLGKHAQVPFGDGEVATWQYLRRVEGSEWLDVLVVAME